MSGAPHIDLKYINGSATAIHNGGTYQDFQNEATVRIEHQVGNLYQTFHGPKPVTLRHKAEDTHKRIKAAWENTPGTCTWLLNKGEFKKWIGMEDQQSFLWIHGMILFRSRAVDDILRHREDKCHLLFFYVSFGDAEPYKSMLMTFWEQAVLQDDTRSTDRFVHSTTRVIQSQLKKVLAEDKRDIYIVIDAVDQLPQGDQQELLGLLRELQVLNQDPKNIGGESRIAVLISSCNESGCIQQQVHKLPCIRIGKKDNGDDIQKYLKQELVLALPESPEKNRLANLARERLKSNADGMFLLAKLQTAYIRNISSETKLEDALDNLAPPDDLNRIYERYVEDFESQEKRSGHPQVALRTMALLAHSSGSMPKEILFTAVALNLHDGKPDQRIYNELSRSPELFVQWCKSLVEFNESLGSFQFCHGSIYEFFQNHQPARDHQLVAELCLAHLGSSDFARGPFTNVDWYNYGGLGPLLRENPFLGFASCNWAVSAKRSIARTTTMSLAQSHRQVLSCFEKLLRCERNLQLSFQIFLMTLGKLMPPEVRSEHIVSFFALHEFLEYFVQNGWLNLRNRDSDDRTAMHWAIKGSIHELGKNDVDELERSHDQAYESKSETVIFVEKLIDRSEDVNALDRALRTPLYYASYYGKVDVVKLLLQHRAKINLKSKEHETPLIAACRGHHGGVVEELLKWGADVEVESSLGTALQRISCIGCCSCAGKILLQYKDKTAPIIENKGPFGTSLHSAAYFGHVKLVKCLLNERRERKGQSQKGIRDQGNDAEKKGTQKHKKRFNIHAKSQTYGSVLTAAAAGCNMGEKPDAFEEISRTLIKEGINVNDESGLYGPALFGAVSNGQLSLVKLLYDNGARPAKETQGAAYQAAEAGDFEDIKAFLRKKFPRIETYSIEKGPSEEVAIFFTLLRWAFETAVLSNDMKTSKSVIQKAEKAFRAAINDNHIKRLRAMTVVCKEVFSYVIAMATTHATRTRAPKGRDLAEDKKKKLAPSQALTNFKPQGAPRRPGIEQSALKIDKLQLSTREALSDEQASGGLLSQKPVFRQSESQHVPIMDQGRSRTKADMERRLLVPGKDKVQLQSPLMSVILPSRLRQSTRVDSFISRPRSSADEAATVRTQSTAGRNNLEDHYSEILDQMTRCAVEILEFAIWKHADAGHEKSNFTNSCNDLPVIELIAESWIEALNNMIANPDFGEPMLETVVKNRADELKEYVQRKMDPGEGFEKAEGLARVGVELLMTSVRRGLPYKHLSYVLAKLWVGAVNRVEELGDQGENGPVWTLIRLFAGRFSNAVESGDKVIAKTYAQGGFMLLRGAALSPQKGLMEKFVEEWVRQWKQAIECGMEDMIQQVAENGLKEYKSFMESGRHEEALGLIVGGMGLLRSAINQGIGKVVYPCLQQIISGFEWTMAHCSEASAEEQKDHPKRSLSNHSQGERSGMDLGDVAEALILLIDTAERRDPDRLARLSPMILELFATVPEDTRQALTDLAKQTIDMTQASEKRLTQMATAITCLLNLELSFPNPRPKITMALGNLAAKMSWITRENKFPQYPKAMGFLKPQPGVENLEPLVGVDTSQGEGTQATGGKKDAQGRVAQTRDNRKTTRNRKKRHGEEEQGQNETERKIVPEQEPQKGAEDIRDELETQKRAEQGKDEKELQSGAKQDRDQTETPSGAEKGHGEKKEQKRAEKEVDETETSSGGEQGHGEKEEQKEAEKELDQTETPSEVKQDWDETEMLSGEEKEWDETEMLSGSEQEWDETKMLSEAEIEWDEAEMPSEVEQEWDETEMLSGAEKGQHEKEVLKGAEHEQSKTKEVGLNTEGNKTEAHEVKEQDDTTKEHCAVEEDQDQQKTQGELDRETRRTQEAQDKDSNISSVPTDFSAFFGVFSFFDGWSDNVADSSRGVADIKTKEDVEKEQDKTAPPANTFLRLLDDTTERREPQPSGTFLRLV